MILKIDKIIEEIKHPPNPNDPLIITPLPNIEELQKSGSASIDLRLGSWFLVPRPTRITHFDIYNDHDKQSLNEAKLVRYVYVPFGESFVLHPKSFILGVTLEWIRLPANRAGYVTARSSWGRYGLIIATATGVHPGFSGCLTLELANIGEVPIVVKPGTAICQLFIHTVDHRESDIDKSNFIGQRRPILGIISLDNIAQHLIRKI